MYFNVFQIFKLVPVYAMIEWFSSFHFMLLSLILLPYSMINKQKDFKSCYCYIRIHL